MVRVPINVVPAGTMPFGKYKAVSLTQVPDSYLEWVLAQEMDISEELEAAIRERLAVMEVADDGDIDYGQHDDWGDRD